MLQAAGESGQDLRPMDESRRGLLLKAAVLKVERRWGLRASGRLFGGHAGCGAEIGEHESLVERNF